LRLHKSTVSRILSTLEIEGLVSKNPETGKYRLGLGLISLAGVALGRLDVRGISQPFLGALVDLSRETVNVVVLDGTECVNIEHFASPQPIRYVGWIGRRMPLHCTAAGKILLAHLPPPERSALLAVPLPSYTEKTVTNPYTLAESLTEIREQGYAIVHEEFEEGFSSIAAPLFNHAGQVVAAVSISGPSYRMDAERIETFIGPLQQVAGQISAQMGYTGEASPLSP